ncbi:Predicted dehydrogenase [Zobellia uliginosa]|uniref:Predicted dehydrogenase n=1 Tax=Zobellia uliginosa TaxID=143224 RepID=A0ABY1L1M2_9FLAO|nr:Gfo/Idh/MocA family oxidoreductase [Zobellia uliginosa]SIT11615.1 Predicted dehydrogenase [Zobellia uliginosa]
MKNLSRRRFIQTTGTAAAGTIIMPNMLTSSRNSTVNVAVIGVNGRGMNNWTQMLGIRGDYRRIKEGLEPDGERKPHKHVNIVAMCDVDDVASATAYKMMPEVRKFKDFRVMLDEMHKDIDAVIVSTPDHTHFAATMAAMERGKHVYVEKPLAHDIWQLRTLKKAAEYYGVVTQLGNQGHASDGIRDFKEWYDQGYVGDVKEIHAWFNGPKFGDDLWFNKPTSYPPVAEPIPGTLAWDLWLGPAKERAYSHYYLPKWWRSHLDLGTGMLGDWGCHTLDAPFWTLDMGMPTSIEPIHSVLSPRPTDFGPDQSILKYEFPKRGNRPALTMFWYEGGKKPENRPEWGMQNVPGNGMIMVGDKQSVFTGGKPYAPKMLMPKTEWDAFQKKGWNKTIRRIPNENPHGEFIDAIRGKGPKPGSSFEYGADLTEVALLGALAQRFNTKIEYDAATMKISNQPALNAYVKEEVRAGWSYGENLWK